MVQNNPEQATSSGAPSAPSDTGDLIGASGFDHAAIVAPAFDITPTTVSQSKDGFPSGRHMIDGFRMMAFAARTSSGAHQKEMAQVYDAVALFIENEAKRADRAEARLKEMGANWLPADGALEAPGIGQADTDYEPKPSFPTPTGKG